jgi:hypothetical protein
MVYTARYPTPNFDPPIRQNSRWWRPSTVALNQSPACAPNVTPHLSTRSMRGVQHAVPKSNLLPGTDFWELWAKEDVQLRARYLCDLDWTSLIRNYYRRRKSCSYTTGQRHCNYSGRTTCYGWGVNCSLSERRYRRQPPRWPLQLINRLLPPPHSNSKTTVHHP